MARRSGTFAGALRAWVRWLRRLREGTVVVRHTEPDAPRPTPDTAAADDVQQIEDAVGPWFHRRYRVTIDGPRRGAVEVMRAIRTNPNVIAEDDLAPFTLIRGDGPMQVGHQYDVRIAGPWNGPVEVVEVDDHHNRMATMEGHMQAGAIETRCAEADGALVFEVESWARSASRPFDLVYDKLGIARALQSEMWISACDHVVSFSGGRRRGPIEVLEERTAEQG